MGPNEPCQECGHDHTKEPYEFANLRDWTIKTFVAAWACFIVAAVFVTDPIQAIAIITGFFLIMASIICAVIWGVKADD